MWRVDGWCGNGTKFLPTYPSSNLSTTASKKFQIRFFSSNGNAFRKAVLVQYPRVGSWTIGFQTGTPQGEVVDHLPGEYMSIYVPTTPNPTSGFFLLMPCADVIELKMSVDEALTYVISMGAVPPDTVKTPNSISS